MLNSEEPTQWAFGTKMRSYRRRYDVNTTSFLRYVPAGYEQQSIHDSCKVKKGQLIKNFVLKFINKRPCFSATFKRGTTFVTLFGLQRDQVFENGVNSYKEIYLLFPVRTEPNFLRVEN